MKNQLLFIVFLALSTAAFAQDHDYGYLGFGHQVGSLRNAYHLNGKAYDDSFSGPIAFFGYENFDEETTNYFNIDGIFTAVASIIKPDFALKLKNYPGLKPVEKPEDYYLLYTPLFDFGGAFTLNERNTWGLALQGGWEGAKIIEIAEDGSGDTEVNNSFGAQYPGLISYGTGVQLFQPLQKLGFRDSRITLTIDWFLGREFGDKWRVNGRKRYTLEAVGMVGRRLYLKAFYQYFDFRNSYWIDNPTTLEKEPINSTMSTFGIAIGFNWISSED